MGVSRIIPFDEGGKRINEWIGRWSSNKQAAQEKKRQREVDDGNEDAMERARQKKKMKKTSGLATAFADMGLIESAVADEDNMEE
jgi:hypothetical protein